MTTEPLHLTPQGQHLLRAEVRRHVAQAGTRRALGTRLHLGTPPHPDAAIDLAGTPHEWDPALARDLVTRMLERAEGSPTVAWLTRSGPLVAGDLEMLWLAATAEGFARHGLSPPDLYLVTRQGWLDVRSGVSRTWVRLRGALPEAG